MKKPKYCEMLKLGFYLVNETNCFRCFYLTGTTSGNKWINLSVPNPQWNALMWTCINKYEVDFATFHNTNPTEFVL